MRSPNVLAHLSIGVLAAISGAAGLQAQIQQNPAVDYSKPNYAYSPPLRKFVDSLPGLTAANANNLGQYLPLAQASTIVVGGVTCDYYEIGLRDYTERLHSDLPATKLRGYYQKNGPDTSSHYLGPVIVASRDRPVVVRFYNELAPGAAGNLFIPIDTTIMGAGMGPDGTNYPQNRAELHLHGGIPPWISDGTPHQWITPANEPSNLKTGVAMVNVPGVPTAAGDQTYYWPNQQSGRLMFYHDHAYGITRNNVYAGEAAGYLLVDPAEEAALRAAGVPGTITGTPDLAHMIPLVIEDKTFVNDGSVPAGFTGTAAQPTTVTDPLWASNSDWGQTKGSLWFPHVYQPNQDPVTGGVNPVGRWDYGPWVWPPALVNNPMLPTNSTTPEAFMDTPVINGTAYPTVTVQPTAYRFRILNACNDRMLSLQLYFADASGTEVTMVPANGATYSGPYGNVVVPFDGRVGGVPDPTTAGPVIYQIGTEGGLLPAVATHNNPPNPVDFDYDRRSMTFGLLRNFARPPEYPNLGYSLLLGPAERADVVIDFSQVPPGSKLILYNDCPAPAPLFDPRYDFFTGGPDLTANGGAPSTMPGYGPNTRTLMQIVVDANGTPTAAFDPQPLTNALPTIFAASQPAPLVPTGIYGNNRLQTGSTFSGYPVHLKTIAEDFDPSFGRMYALLGTEVSSLNTQGQQTFGFDYVAPSTEFIPEGSAPDGTQIWSIVHNGIDMHAIHFHLFNVQIINRVDWAGIVKPPDANELGWRDTVRCNPLENLIVAVKPMKPTVPFAVPTSVRPMDVTVPATGPLGAAYDPLTMPNPLTDFDWEYVWHCHLLGHEENDMMRPLILVSVPFAVTNLTATVNAAATQVTLTWLDQSKNEDHFVVERATDSLFATGMTSFTVAANNGTLANAGGLGMQLSLVDPSVTSPHTYYYRVGAVNAAGTSPWAVTGSVVVQVLNTPAQPSAITYAAAAFGVNPIVVTVNWVDASNNETGFVLQRQQLVNNVWGAWAPLTITAANVTTFVDTTVAPSRSYRYRVAAFNPNVTPPQSTQSAWRGPNGNATTGPTGVPTQSPNSLQMLSQSTSQVRLTWADRSLNELQFEVQVSAVGTNGPWVPLGTVAGSNTASKTFTFNAAVYPAYARRTTYWFRVRATNDFGASAWTNVLRVTTL